MEEVKEKSELELLQDEKKTLIEQNEKLTKQNQTLTADLNQCRKSNEALRMTIVKMAVEATGAVVKIT